MFYALNETSKDTIFVDDYCPDNSIKIVCPECNHRVIFKDGFFNTKHFAHAVKSPEDCSLKWVNSGEGYEHLSLKKDIYTALNSNNHPATLEYKVGSTRTDIFTVIDGQGICIEVQYSNIDPHEILSRMSEHNKHGHVTMWVLGRHSEVRGVAEYRVKQWQKFLHKNQWGVVFYHDSGINFTPVHYGSIYREGSEWYEPGGHLVSSSGRWLNLTKRLITPKRSIEIHNLTSCTFNLKYKGVGIEPKDIFWTPDRAATRLNLPSHLTPPSYI